jgi:hypothetical protein
VLVFGNILFYGIGMATLYKAKERQIQELKSELAKKRENSS